MNDKIRFIYLYVNHKKEPAFNRFIVLIFILLFSNFSVEAQNNIRVATAANLANATKKVAENFTQKTGIKVDVISSASGKLTAQILNGAPFHIFISADMKYPQRVYEMEKGYGLPLEMAQGQLVYWSKNDLGTTEVFIHLNRKEQKGKIAIANPKLAPYGATTQELLNKKKLWTLLKPRLVYGENIGQVNRLIYSGAVDGAFTSSSAMHAKELEDRGFWYVIKGGSGISHGVVRLSYSKVSSPKATEQFFEYLFSKEAQEVFRTFGYSTTNNKPQKNLTK